MQRSAVLILLLLSLVPTTFGQSRELELTDVDADGIHTSGDAEVRVGWISAGGDHFALQVNGDGSETSIVYDVFGRATTTIRTMTSNGHADGAVQARVFVPASGPTVETHGATIVTQATYDRVGNVETRVDDQLNLTTYEYDGQHRLRKRTYADGEFEEYTYDSDGLMLSRLDENGDTVTYMYDGGHRLVELNALSSDATLRRDCLQVFEHDGLDRVVYSIDYNDVVSSTDDHECARAYDSLGRVTSEVLDGTTVASDYDLAGNKELLTYPVYGGTVGVAFDSMNRPESIDHPELGLDAIMYAYEGARGRTSTRTVSTAPFAVVSTPTYDTQLGRVIGLDHASGATTVQSYDWDYNRSNHRVREERSRNLVTFVDEWEYDSAGRLIQEREGATLSGGVLNDGEVVEYYLDGVGNWKATRRTPYTGTVPGAPVENVNLVNPRNAYTEFEGTTVQNDDAGSRVVGLGGTQYEYDALKRLVSTDAVTYEYFADHRRAARVDGSVVTSFYYDGDRLLEAVDSTGDGWSWVYGKSASRVVTASKHSGGVVDTYVLVEDALGSTVGLFDSTGALVEQYDYDAYGNVTVLDGTGAVQATPIGQPILYAGYYYDAGENQYWLKYRVYDPETGRFLTNDPIGIWGDVANWGNGYGYAGFNPISWLDILGLITAEEADALFAAMQRMQENDALSAALLAKMEAGPAPAPCSSGCHEFPNRSFARDNGYHRGPPVSLDPIGSVGAFAGGLVDGFVGAWSDNFQLLSNPVQVATETFDGLATLGESLRKDPGGTVGRLVGEFADTVSDPEKLGASLGGTFGGGNPISRINRVAGIVQKGPSGGIRASAPKSVHGNSRDSTKPQHRYEIEEVATGDKVKTGISGGKLNKDGSSRRANSQVNKLNKAEGEGTYKATVPEKDLPGRRSGLESEQNATDRLAREGNLLRLQKRPKPRNEGN